MSESLTERIDALLPQTQCTQCGYSGCRPYAQAIAAGDADIDRCPPGGAAGIAQLAALLGVPVKPLNPAHGTEQPRRVAVINEAECIGCTKCLPPCPVDAILGANKLMHTVITAECTGCELCLAPCPVDCIVMHDPGDLPAWDREAADRARRRHQHKLQRVEKQQREQQARLTQQKQRLAQLQTAKNNSLQ